MLTSLSEYKASHPKSQSSHFHSRTINSITKFQQFHCIIYEVQFYKKNNLTQKKLNSRELKRLLFNKKKLLRNVASMAASTTAQCTYGMEIMCLLTHSMP